MKNLLYIVALFIAIVVLPSGYFIHQQFLSVPEADDLPQTVIENGILAFPDHLETIEEKHHFLKLVEMEAVEATLLNIGGCKPDPAVIKVGHGESIMIKNPDTIVHTLIHKKIGRHYPASKYKKCHYNFQFG